MMNHGLCHVMKGALFYRRALQDLPAKRSLLVREQQQTAKARDSSSRKLYLDTAVAREQNQLESNRIKDLQVTSPSKFPKW